MDIHPVAPKTRKLRSQKAQRALFAYLMLAPDVIGLLVFLFLPVVLSVYTSFHSWNALNPKMTFVAFQNYLNLLRDKVFWDSLVKTLLYTLMFVPMIFCASLLLALFVDSLPKRAEGFFRTVYFVPFAISTVVASLMWLFMFDPQRGIINDVLRALGLPPQSFLGNPKQALFCIAFISVWSLVGYYSIIFLAALKDVPRSYYESARLDGANAFVLFRSITFPLLREVNTFVLLVTTIASFQVFDLIKIMTNGGPANATNVTVFHIYTNAFQYSQLGYAAAMAVVLFTLIFAVSAFQLKFLQKGEGEQ
ncbi:carbohydrate ABC transporter permease [Bacillota bacterium Meth-B3]|nr:sugar ABC transporter permease [Christensenellaceae bacterium]MEA5064631.1 sugar ABC transporter permease [Eubacteriales bacterium]